MLAAVAPGEWDPLCRRLGVTDVYYARGFVAASAPLAGGEPLLLHLAGSGGDVVFALVRRADPVDVVTPYGYGGPLGTGADPPLAAFADAYESWCAEAGVLSTFAVFHPLLDTAETPATARFHRSPLAGTVAWPLAGDLEAGMHRHHRRLVRRARGAGLRAAVVERPDELGGFAELYETTMRRAGAAPFYFFGPAYWEALARDVALVRVDVLGAGGELAASVLGMGAPPLLHYHLGGSTDAGRRAGASQLALLALAEWGAGHGYAVLHLGGGVGGRADSLLEFKLRFAPDGLVPAAIGKAVHDPEAYLRRAGAAAIDWDGFFPAYRAAR